MYLTFLRLCCVVLMGVGASIGAQPLKVCADPDNLPFSNRAAQGFDNKIAELLAADLHRPVQFIWQRAGRGFVREMLNKGLCDALVGVPVQFRPVLTTSPYYASSYVFVTRRSRKLNIKSFDDPRLRTMKIGVQVLEDDYTPAARALSRRQLTPNIVGFDVAGDEAGKIITAVTRGKIDIAVVWGPLAGYFARRQKAPLQLSPVEPEIDPPALPFRYEMGVGVRKSDRALRDQLEAALARHHAQIERILRAYSVPEYRAGSKEARLR